MNKQKIAEGKYGVIYALPHNKVEKRCVIEDREEKEVFFRDVRYLKLLQPLRVTPKLFKHRFTAKSILRKAKGVIVMDQWTMDMKQLGEYNRKKHFPLIHEPVYRRREMVSALRCLLQLKLTGIINTDTKRDNFLWDARRKKMCLTDFGFANEFDEKEFHYRIGWPLIYFPREDPAWKKKIKKAHVKKRFLRVFRKYPQYISLWEWEAEALAMGTRVWIPNKGASKTKKKTRNNSWKHGKLKIFTGLGEDVLPDAIRQEFVQVNPYIQACYRREERYWSTLAPHLLWKLTRKEMRV